jgi:membrane protease YdiL (CAAX protease family)
MLGGGCGARYLRRCPPQRPAQRSGGERHRRAALGLDRIRRSDWLPWITGVGFAYLGRTVIGVLALVLSDGKVLDEAGNISGGDGSVVSIVVLVLVTVVLAPVAGELTFRGPIVRAIMRRLRIWPAVAFALL